MQPFYLLQVNINKQFNILYRSTRTRERFEQSWTALRRFKTDMCGAAIQYLGTEGATFVKFLLLIIWLQPSSLPCLGPGGTDCQSRPQPLNKLPR